jgi:eukaryotic-like serine/threonine-protein kinase
MDATIIDGRYLLLEPLGSGGEAQVFRARDNTDESDVALRLSLNPGTPSAAVDPPALHDSWVRLLNVGSDSVFGAYQIFELLAGWTLAELIQVGPLEPDDWRLLVVQTLDALDALHEIGWVHGDLNADNLFQTEAGWKLLELPFYRFAPPANRSPVFGSIHTIAPEQIDRAPASIQSDLYSIACLYYYAASGTYPHPGANSREIAIHCLRFSPEALGPKAPQLPAEWCDWVITLLARDPAQRVYSPTAARQLLGVA